MNPRLRNGRVQTQGFDAVQQIQPAGLPGSTYVRPLDQGHPGADLQALSEAFGGLSSSLKQLSNSRESAAAHAASEAKSDAREERRIANETEAANRESARDATAAAKSLDEENKLKASQVPWATLSTPELQQVVTDNNNPNGNVFSFRMASTTLGVKSGQDFTTQLNAAYANYDPSSGQTVRQYLEERTQKWLNTTYPDVNSEQQRLARQGAWSILDTHINGIEGKEKSFSSDSYKQSYTEGIAANASNTIVDGKQKGHSADTIATEFLHNMAAFREAAKGDRAHPELVGVDAVTPFKKAIEGAAASGDIELVNAMLNKQVPGMRASLLTDPDQQQWAESTKAKAITRSNEIVRGNAMGTRANLKYLASLGDLNDELIKSNVDAGVISQPEGEDYMVMSRTNKAQAMEKARTAAAKSQAEMAHNTAKDAIVVGIVDTAVSGGGLSGIQDRQVPSKDGTGTVNYSVKDQLDDGTARWEEQNGLKKEAVRVQAEAANPGSGAAAAEEFDMNSKVEFYGDNYQLENKQWKALFGNVSAGASMNRWVATKGNVPADVKLAFETYDKLVTKSPTLAASYVTDEKTRIILESYHIAKTQADAFDGGGTSSPEHALGQALDIATRLTEHPDTVQGVRWNDKSVASLNKEIAKTGQSIGGFFKGTVPSDLTQKTKDLADFYSRSGLNEQQAIARAVAVIKKDYVQVNSGSLSGGYLVDSKGISNKEGFKDFMDTVVPEKVHFARGGPQDPANDSGDYYPVRFGENWILKDANGTGILTDSRGKQVIITPKDYEDFANRRIMEAFAEAKDKANGKASPWEIVYNGLINNGGEDINRFWALKEKWDTQQKVQSEWEQKRIDREGGDGTTNSVTKVEQTVRDKMTAARKEASSNLNPAFYDAATPDLSPLMMPDAPDSSANFTTDALKPLVIQAESGGVASRVSPTGNHFGLMQLGWDSAAVDAAKELGLTEYLTAGKEKRIDMLMDKDFNEKLGTKYLDMMVTKYHGNAEQTLVAYNWGQGNADKWIAGGSKWKDLPAETQDYVSKIMAHAPQSNDSAGLSKDYTPGKFGSRLQYSNGGAIRNHRVTPTLEAKLDFSVSTYFGKGYTVRIFSGGQPAKGTAGARTGSTRHDDHGHGGRAADVYIYDPKGNKVRDTAKLKRFTRQWIATGMGSAGEFMSDFGMHLDELTQDKLGPGQKLSWLY